MTSANNNTKASEMCDGKSLVKAANRSRPSILPCRTPERTGATFDKALLICTYTLSRQSKIKPKPAPEFPSDPKRPQLQKQLVMQDRVKDFLSHIITFV